MGAIPLEGSTSFRVWAPHATTVSVVGEFNNWNPGAHPLGREEGSLWAREASGAVPGEQY
jgi:1,4-alpha-glucan branching enzyme